MYTYLLLLMKYPIIAPDKIAITVQLTTRAQLSPTIVASTGSGRMVGTMQDIVDHGETALN